VKLILDTCTFLWVVAGDVALTSTALELVRDPENDVFLSAASAWEVSIKFALGRLPLPSPPEVFVPSERSRHRIDSLAIEEAVALHVRRLPPLHRDPFDRLLVSQAILGGFTIVTPDAMIAQYGISVAW
jgi:PIN domain nuclease of toxin-antitoxin system